MFNCIGPIVWNPYWSYVQKKFYIIVLLTLKSLGQRSLFSVPSGSTEIYLRFSATVVCWWQNLAFFILLHIGNPLFLGILLV